MLAMAAEQGGNPDDPNKRHPLDFVLWQPSLPDEPSWESRWGPGRPGWHIECSALALRELGETIDVHGGGRDLVFPHHECETAQSESVTGRPFVRHWLHVGLVGLDGTKMSKSLGNLVFVGDLLKEWEPAAVRLALLAHHYRPDWEWTGEDLPRAAARLEAWRAAPPVAPRAGPAPGGEPATDRALELVRARLDDDLDTPGALAALDAEAASAVRWRGGGPAGRYPVDRGPIRGRPATAPTRPTSRPKKGTTMAAVTVRLPDGSTKEFDAGTTAYEFAESIGPRLAKAAVAATFDGAEVDLATPLPRRRPGDACSPPSPTPAGRCSATRPPTSWPRPCSDCGPAPTTPSAR